MIVFDTESGKTVARLDCAEDPDDIFYDVPLRRIYVSCGEGFINVYEQQDANHYKITAKISTAPSARTALLVPELRRLYLAVPHRSNQIAELRVYKVE